MTSRKNKKEERWLGLIKKLKKKTKGKGDFWQVLTLFHALGVAVDEVVKAWRAWLQWSWLGMLPWDF